VSALKYNAARQLETTLPRAATTPAPIAPESRRPAAVETIKSAPTKIEVAKQAPPRRRRSAASLIGEERDAAADELMALMKKMRSTG